MKLNHKVCYAMACLLELSKYPGEFLQADQIVKAQHIPHAFTHKVLQSLANGGLVLSHKGSGYKLARPLKDITAYELMGVFSQVEPNEPNGLGSLLEKRINQALASFSLGDVLQ